MASELPYLPSYKNVELVFTKIAGAKQPDTFTQRFLMDTLGLKSVGDRALITLLKTLGFLDPGGRPTAQYGSLKNPSLAKASIAQATRQAYEPLFAANEKANELAPNVLSGLISQVAGTDSGITSKIAGTFRALVKCGDFAATPPSVESEAEEMGDGGEESPETVKGNAAVQGKLSTDFHFNIQVHLPTNATEETYLNIFSALRKAFK
jgi:hypothetical protein